MNLNLLILIVVLVGGLIVFAGNVLLLIAAFRRGILWGLGSLFVPFVSLAFLCIYWAEAKRGFLTVLLGVALVVLPLFIVPEFRQTVLKSFPDKKRESVDEKPEDLEAQIMEKRELLERLVPQVAATGSNLGRDYKALELQRKSLKPGDTAAIVRFNELAATYQAQNARTKELQRQIAVTDAELNQLLARRSTMRTGPAGRRIVMYTTSHCGACKAAKQYMGQRGIAFEEHDVEGSRSAMEEFERLGGRGVPLILVGEKRLEGFSPQALEAML